MHLEWEIKVKYHLFYSLISHNKSKLLVYFETKLVFMAVGRPAVGHVRATWVWGEAGLGGAGIAPGGHVV